MSKFRYTVTFDCDEGYFTSEDCEELRQEIEMVCETYYVNDLKVKCEDEYCIKKNDRLDRVITAESQAKHFNLLKIHVITQEDLDLFIQDGECTSLDDLEVSTTNFDWDFAQRALVDVDKKEIIMWNDNIHTDIDDDIDRFLDGITYVGNTYSLKVICLLEDDMEQYEGVRYK